MSNTTISTDAFLKGTSPPLKRRGMINPTPPDGKRYSVDTWKPSYYTEAYGKALLPTLIEMIRERKDKEFLKGAAITTETTYQKVQQSFAYLLDKMDDDGLLETLRREVVLKKTPRGVVLCFAENAERYTKQTHLYNVTPRTAAFDVRDATSVAWRESVNDFMEDTGRPELKLTDGFVLSGEDINDLRTMVELVPEDMAITIVTITQFKIHLRRNVQ